MRGNARAVRIGGEACGLLEDNDAGSLFVQRDPSLHVLKDQDQQTAEGI